ncbi:hypothetical protein F5B20DRAFT_584858 [Whalleya microplaca]|nr:hypothetical protein F5B20DRAFT_584858 [Whalleya microplaca]
MPNRTPVKLLNQPGFWFSGEQFSYGGNAAASRRCYYALCGDDLKESSKAALRELGRIRATELFTICVKHEVFFDIWRHNLEAVFKLINDEWVAYSDTEPDDLRSEFEAGQLPDEPQQLVLTINPSPANIMTNTFQGINISAADNPTSATVEWPPKDFAPEKHQLLADTRLRDELYNVNNDNPKTAPVPSTDTHPLEIKKFLCLLALSHFPRRHPFALYMKLIGYLTSKDRRAAFTETGGQSKIYGTMDEFVEYSKAILNNRERDMAIGLVTGKDHSAGMVIVIRNLGLDNGFQFTCFDPSTGSDKSREQVMDKMSAHAAGITEAWWGGYCPDIADQPRDIINVACQFVAELVADRFFLPLHDRDNQMASRGFERVELARRAPDGTE